MGSLGKKDQIDDERNGDSEGVGLDEGEECVGEFSCVDSAACQSEIGGARREVLTPGNQTKSKRGRRDGRRGRRI